ncbi:MAG TPA: DNA topoisomerase IB [Methylomirabilota bacterium]|nr:DNA topoisomerase IB [Methylomirabilota bacterium]
MSAPAPSRQKSPVLAPRRTRPRAEPSPPSGQTPVDGGEPAGDLNHVDAASLEIVRRRRGRGFSYHAPDGARIGDSETLSRIRGLAVPPAYRDVRIAADPRAHLQAVGLDDMDRLQYRYHSEWEAVREATKADRLAIVLACLPRLRRAVARDLADRRLSRNKALAVAVALIDAGAIRVGCEVYLKSSGSRGAATLIKRDVALVGDTIRLGFKGKGGRDIACTVEDARLARALRRISKLPGRRLLQYLDEAGLPRRIGAADVNGYLRKVARRPISAKDLRMLSASAAAAERLVEMDPEPSQDRRRRQLAAVMSEVSRHLANTPAVVRKSYVHRLVVDGFLSGALKKTWKGARSDGARQRIENALHRLIRAEQSGDEARKPISP